MRCELFVKLIRTAFGFFWMSCHGPIQVASVQVAPQLIVNTDRITCMSYTIYNNF